LKHFKKYLLNFITDPNKLLYFPWYPDAFFPSVAFILLAPFLKKLAPKKGLQGPLWPSSKIFWPKHCKSIINFQWTLVLELFEGMLAPDSHCPDFYKKFKYSGPLIKCTT